jgi:hypothetical protein
MARVFPSNLNSPRPTFPPPPAPNQPATVFFRDALSLSPLRLPEPEPDAAQLTARRASIPHPLVFPLVTGVVTRTNAPLTPSRLRLPRKLRRPLFQIRISRRAARPRDAATV